MNKINIHNYLGKYKLSLSSFSRAAGFSKQQLIAMLSKDKPMFDSILRYELGYKLDCDND